MITHRGDRRLPMRCKQSAMPERRFPPPWTVDDLNNACFIVRDENGQQLGYFYPSRSPAGARPPIC